MEYETHEEGLLFDNKSSNPSLDRRPVQRQRRRKERSSGTFLQKGERIPEEDDQLA